MRSVNVMGQQVARQATTSPLAENMMRLGFIVRGLVYGTIGVLALQVAVGGRGTVADSQGAIVTMSKTPFGSFLLVIILIGLVGYSLWGVVRALFDVLHKGSDMKGLAARAGYAISAVSYGFLALATFGLLTGAASAASNGSQTTQTQQTTASILSYSWGPWAIGIVALLMMGGGLVQVVQGLRADFDQQFQPYALDENQRKWLERLGRFGTAARGLVFTGVGLFLLLAALYHDPKEARGIDGVLTSLLHQPYGPWLMGIVALGLVAFGIYSAASGIWLRFKR